MSQSAGDAARWRALEANSGIGLPIPPGDSHRLTKRLIARLCRPFLLHQIRFNQDLLAELVTLRDGLVEQFGPSGAMAQSSEHRLADLERRVHDYGVQLDAQQSWFNAEHERVERHDWAVEAMLPVVEKHGYAIDAVIEKLEDLEVDRDLVHQEVELAQQQSFARMHDGLAIMRSELVDLGRRIDESRADVQRAVAIRAELDGELAGVRWRLAQVDLLLDAVRRTLPEVPPLEQLAAMPTALENLYGALEEAMRGSYESILERVRPYLGVLAETPDDLPVLDIGCGRGEWLDVLKGAGIPAYGVDMVSIYQSDWTARGLDVRVGDAREHLLGLKECSLRAISAIHVVEHLATAELLEFLDLARAAIAPGGVIILETPNPENLIVGSSSFYLDPTHLQPLPARLLAFFVSSRGFAEVETRYLARSELVKLERPESQDPWASDLVPVIDAINAHLYAPQDYAVIARRI